MNAKLNLNLTAIAVALSLSACGGGGSPSDPVIDNPGGLDPTNPSLSQPQLTVAPPNYSDAHKVNALNQINEIRARAGLGLLAQNAKLDQASQAHADWQVLNDTMSHGEAQGTTGFTGINSWARILAAGYQAAAGSEIIAYPTANRTSKDAIESLSNTIYHRIALLEPTFIDVGLGIQFSGEPRPVNVKMAIPQGSLGQAIPNNAPAVVWPIDGSTGIKVAMGPEDPNPIPEVSPYAVGFPASVHCPRNKTLSVNSFKMETIGGDAVDAVLRHWSIDPNNIFQSVKCAAGLVPRAHLQPGTTYKVEFNGSIDGVPFSKQWQFTTVQYN